MSSNLTLCLWAHEHIECSASSQLALLVHVDTRPITQCFTQFTRKIDRKKTVLNTAAAGVQVFEPFGRLPTGSVNPHITCDQKCFERAWTSEQKPSWKNQKHNVQGKFFCKLNNTNSATKIYMKWFVTHGTYTVCMHTCRYIWYGIVYISEILYI